MFVVVVVGMAAGWEGISEGPIGCAAVAKVSYTCNRRRNRSSSGIAAADFQHLADSVLSVGGIGRTPERSVAASLAFRWPLMELAPAAILLAVGMW